MGTPTEGVLEWPRVIVVFDMGFSFSLLNHDSNNVSSWSSLSNIIELSNITALDIVGDVGEPDRGDACELEVEAVSFSVIDMNESEDENDEVDVGRNGREVGGLGTICNISVSFVTVSG